MTRRTNIETPVDRTELVSDDLHTMVGELRRIGICTRQALLDIARKLRLGKRRLTHLYYRDQQVTITDEQQSWIAAGAIRVLLHLATEHEIAAVRCRVRAEEIRERQRQLELPLSGAVECSQTSSLPCAA